MVLWKNIEGHSGAYLISNEGVVFNQLTGKPLKSVIGTNGYCHVTLCYGVKEDVSIHRLVAQAFIPNPDNLPEVNHKDENKANNSVDNLEWCTCKYNANYGLGALRRNTAIIQKDKAGNVIKQWNSMKEAAGILGLKYQSISRVCRGLRKTCGGYKWEYLR